MSIRAYRLNCIEHEQGETFNLWYDTKLVQFFDKEYSFYTTLNEGGGGLTELPVEALKRAIKELDIETDIKNALQKDIDDAKKKGVDYIQYYCL